MKPSSEAAEVIRCYENPAPTVAEELKALKADWNSKLDNLKVSTPSPEFDTMINTWNAYNCFMTFIWSRAASFIYCGLRNGYGYRDTVQDIQGIIHLAPKMALEKIRFMLSAQVNNGGGLPLVKFITHLEKKILRMMLLMYRKPAIRLTVQMMHYGFSQLYINIFQKPETLLFLMK